MTAPAWLLWSLFTGAAFAGVVVIALAHARARKFRTRLLAMGLILGVGGVVGYSTVAVLALLASS